MRFPSQDSRIRQRAYRLNESFTSKYPPIRLETLPNTPASACFICLLHELDPSYQFEHEMLQHLQDLFCLRHFFKERFKMSSDTGFFTAIYINNGSLALEIVSNKLKKH